MTTKLLALSLSLLLATNANALDCNSIKPSSRALNLSNIQSCLDKGKANLNGKIFEIESSLRLPGNAVLNGNQAQIKLMKPSFSLLEVGSNARAYFLKLNGNKNITGKSSAIVHFNGDGSIIDHSHIYNSHSTGVYFIGQQSTGNKVLNSQIRDNFYGVIFRYTYSTSHVNKLQQNRIHNNDCDGITLAGFGIVTANRIYRNGRDCQNNLAGAGIYALRNKKGALILGNEIYDNRGHNIDLSGVQHFIIEGNESYNPGFDFNKPSKPNGATALALFSGSYNKIRYNSLLNKGRASNIVAFTRTIRSMSYPHGGIPFQDLPHGKLQTIAMFLGNRADSQSTGNEVIGNAIRSYCTPGCVGLGLFVTRGTKGNTFEDNTMFGSQFGSRRCGDNNYDNGVKNHECQDY